MVTIKVNFSDTLAAKAFLLLFNELPTAEKLSELSDKTVDTASWEKEDAEQSLMMAMALIGSAE